jgi:pyruvate,orthophosphate dikinase
MNIGVLGGAFDPVHYGHLKIAEFCKEKLKLDKVLFVPSGNPPHKKPVASYQHRVKMLELALKDYSAGWRILAELEKPSRIKHSYTIDTLKKLKKIYPHASVFFIIGEDNVPEIKGWHNYKNLFDYATFVVLRRPGVIQRSPNWRIEYKDKIRFIDSPKIDIASSDIRKKLSLGEKIDGLLPKVVADYIKKNKLYRKPPAGGRGAQMKKYVYFFGAGHADGNKEMKDILGGKGANLAEMVKIGVPVPPGFTISAEVCNYYNQHEQRYPNGLEEEIEANLGRLEKSMKSKFGDPTHPLLLSVRSGAAISMPGMMDTILNIGLNDDVAQGFIEVTQNPRFVWDAYRRLVQMFGNVVFGVSAERFEDEIARIKNENNISLDIELTADDLRYLTNKFKNIYKEEVGEPFPQDPKKQLWLAIEAVFKSWNTKRAVEYRKIHHITGLLGTAVNTQTMVFGNMGNDCATGVAFTRDPATGEKRFFGEFLINAQGEDVVAGIRTPQIITKEASVKWAKDNGISEEERKKKFPSLEEVMPEVYKELYTIQQKLENHYKDMQDIEFTIQKGKLYILQTRTGKRTAKAAVKIAVDMVKERMISKELALLRIETSQLDQLLHPMFSPDDKQKAVSNGRLLARGLPASPGAAVGKVIFFADDAVVWKERNQQVILVRMETSPEDIAGMNAAEGILTAHGGMTSHAAVVARGMGKCCVAGCGELNIDYKNRRFTVKNRVIKEGDYISIDGTTGEVIEGRIKTVPPELAGEFEELMSWAETVAQLHVHANADTPGDAKTARNFGAVGIGLCRTEHMFFGGDRIDYMRGMILAESPEERRKPLVELKKMQVEDFIGILEAMHTYPVTIRLLDPPLHEFLPDERDEEEINKLAQKFDKNPQNIYGQIKQLKEFNPMLGHRGCRLGITFPDIYEMQVEAIIEAACTLKKKGIDVKPEIMIPLVGHVKEFTIIEKRAREIADEIIKENGLELNYKVGTMIEVPRACVVADQIAQRAEFFSFGTNDLTQMGCGFSRDDAAKFLNEYVKLGIYEYDPFQVLDREGVGELVRMAVEKGKKGNPNLVVGICGEHGGEPHSIEFCHKIGLDYVSCSPYRVPIARLSAAQSAIKNKS